MMTMTTATVEATQSIPESPYRGIESFRYADQSIFFARDVEAQKLLRYVTIYRGVLLYGDSGSGKSSLINAGFIPLVIMEGFTPDRLRVQPVPGEEIIVERIALDDKGKSGYLPSNFVEDNKSGARTVLSTVEFKQMLHDLPPGRRPLLIFDQFEEFATLFEEVPRGDMLKRAQQAQESILRLLVELMRDEKLAVKLLFVFREDYLAKLSKLFSRSPELLDQHLRITALSTAALNQIIRGSFEKFPGHFKKELSEELTRELTAALEARSDSDRLNLSEVQIVCLKLWESGNPEALFKEKGVQGVLEEYLYESLDRLPEDLRDPALCLLSRMVTDSGTRNIISEYDLITQVKEDEGIPEDRLNEALRALVGETKLVRRERRRDVYFYDIVSEFLVPWISRKKTERRTEIERHELEKAEGLKRRKAYRLVGLSLLLTITIAVSALYIYAKRTSAAIATDRVQYAEQQRAEAEQKEKEAKAAKLQAETAKAQAEAQLNQVALAAMDQKNQLEQELQKVITQAEQEKTDLNSRLTKAAQDKDAVLKDRDNAMKDKAAAENQVKQLTQEKNAAIEKQKQAEEDGLRQREKYLSLQTNYTECLKRYQSMKRQSAAQSTQP